MQSPSPGSTTASPTLPYHTLDVTNVAFGRSTVSQSSIWGSSGPALAVDGRVPQRRNSVEWCIHTNGDANAWWEVDLGRVYPITNVTIVGRTHQTNQGDNLQVWIRASQSGSAQPCGGDDALWHTAATRSQHHTDSTVEVPCNMAGRFVRVRSTTAGQLVRPPPMTMALTWVCSRTHRHAPVRCRQRLALSTTAVLEVAYFHLRMRRCPIHVRRVRRIGSAAACLVGVSARPQVLCEVEVAVSTEAPTMAPSLPPTVTPTAAPTLQPTSPPTLIPTQHACNDGSHGCDTTAHGICERMCGRDGSCAGFQCSCVSTHHCSDGDCTAVGHTCEWNTDGPTVAPTPAPSAAPTANPTGSPTRWPTYAPQRSPTAAPSAAPTTPARPAGAVASDCAVACASPGQSSKVPEPSFAWLRVTGLGRAIDAHRLGLTLSIVRPCATFAGVGRASGEPAEPADRRGAGIIVAAVVAVVVLAGVIVGAVVFVKKATKASGSQPSSFDNPMYTAAGTGSVPGYAGAASTHRTTTGGHGSNSGCA